MKNSGKRFKLGTRASRLALIQARAVTDRFGALLPEFAFEIVPASSPGDRDQAADLRASPADFFTRDLDEALLSGVIDLAAHSAKDMPEPLPAGVEGFWLPDGEDPRDALVLAPGQCVEDLKSAPRLAVSSDRRAAWCRARFPEGVQLPVRGTIEERLAQLDAGKFDALVMAGAALIRLGLASRITQWIPAAELPAPAGQGVLGVTFRAGDPVWTRLRSLYVKPVVFVGAGAGMADACTLAGVAALRACEVCVYDALLDPALLAYLPPGAERIEAGKRGGSAQHPQVEITATLLRQARRGRRVVRIKGGDPGIFGRLAEEAGALEAAGLPFRIVPGVSSLNAATTGVGLALTQRGLSAGFCAMTARAASGAVPDLSTAVRGALPVIFFMGAGVAREAADALMRDGWPGDTPASAIFAAGTEDERVIEATLATLASRLEASELLRPAAPGSGVRAIPAQPALILCGEVARRRLCGDVGALRGMRVLVTASEALGEAGARAVRDFGGVPVCRPLIRLSPIGAAPRPWAQRLSEAAWLAVSSPSAVDCLMAVLREERLDIRVLPRILAAGAGTVARLERYGVRADLAPAAEFGTCGMLACVREQIPSGTRIVRLRAEQAGSALTEALREAGLAVEDLILYRSEPIRYERLPAFDAALFASGSAVASFVSAWGVAVLVGRQVAAFPGSAAAALQAAGLTAFEVAAESCMVCCVAALARVVVRQDLEAMR